MKLGVQAFTILEECLQDFAGTLREVHDLGFHFMEWINLIADEDPGLGNGLSPKESLKVFADNDIRLTGAIFVGNDTNNLFFDMDRIQRIIDWYQEAGCTTLGIADDKFVEEDFFKRRMDAYNEIGRRCKEAGIHWMYHNHFHEQQRIGGKTILEQMLALTDPELVGFDLDVYWSLRGLVDPVKFIREHGMRMRSIHCKDFPFDKLDVVNMAKRLHPDEPLTFEGEDYYDLVGEDEFIECGQGIIKWQEVIDAANEVGCPYMFVEQDFSVHPKYECLELSKKYLETLDGLMME